MKKLIKQNKWKLIISSILILLPALFGVIMKDVLPEQMVIHWGVTGEPDGWAGVFFATLFLPFFLLVLHWVGIFFTFKDNERREQNKKIIGMTFWITPVISLWTNGIIYATAFGLDLDMSFFATALIGVAFIVIGNYMPKCKQNRTIGIKIKWTLANEENWNATHRFGGRVWVAGGIICLATSFLPSALFPFFILSFMLLMCGLPMLYSYLFYKKQLREGRATKEQYKHGGLGKKGTVAALIVVALTIAILAVICFTGNIKVVYEDGGFTVEASYWGDLTLNYADIESVEYRESDEAGQRVSGFGTPRLLMGSFRNDEFGNYIRYSYGDRESGCVVIRAKGTTYVIGCESTAKTQALYKNIIARSSVGG